VVKTVQFPIPRTWEGTYLVTPAILPKSLSVDRIVGETPLGRPTRPSTGGDCDNFDETDLGARGHSGYLPVLSLGISQAPL
jgi:hypothetical protein